MLSTKIREKSIGNMRFVRLLAVLLVPVAALILGTAAPEAWADEELEFDEADVYAELNDTDGDLGFHALIDGEGWKKLEIEDPNDREILEIRAKSILRRQGITELFFESAEPTFDELSPQQFFRRFPKGEYEIEGVTLDGEELESVDLFRHVMPEQPGYQEDTETVEINLNGVVDTVIREECDEDDAAFSPAVVPLDVDGNIVISWDPVEDSHPTIGEEGNIEVALYQLVVEAGDSVYSVDLPDDVTMFVVPGAFLDLADGDPIKYEVLVKEDEGGNQTAVESCFVVAE